MNIDKEIEFDRFLSNTIYYVTNNKEEEKLLAIYLREKCISIISNQPSDEEYNTYADEFIDKMPDGYDTHIEQGGTNVSGGQRQRLCIARALLKKPKIIIFDDSTSAVDTATEAKIRVSLQENIPDTTKIIIAQRISSVRHADKIIVLDNGRIDGIGTHDELVASNAIYREVFESQTCGGDFDENGGDE